MGIEHYFVFFILVIFPTTEHETTKKLRDKLKKEVWMRKEKKIQKFYFVFHKVAKVDDE